MERSSAATTTDGEDSKARVIRGKEHTLFLLHLLYDVMHMYTCEFYRKIPTSRMFPLNVSPSSASVPDHSTAEG